MSCDGNRGCLIGLAWQWTDVGKVFSADLVDSHDADGFRTSNYGYLHDVACQLFRLPEKAEFEPFAFCPHCGGQNDVEAFKRVMAVIHDTRTCDYCNHLREEYAKLKAAGHTIESLGGEVGGLTEAQLEMKPHSPS